jgi:hypothetical protein
MIQTTTNPSKALSFLFSTFQQLLLHKDDQITDAVYCRVRGYEFREECKRKQEATSRNIEVRQQTEQVEQDRKRKFSAATIARQESKAEDAIVVKKERRSYGVTVECLDS